MLKCEDCVLKCEDFNVNFWWSDSKACTLSLVHQYRLTLVLSSQTKETKHTLL